MNEERTKRSLKAIFSADVKGYSRLMGQDEVGTVSRLKEYRQVMISHIERCGGRIVDSPGDNILVEFASVVDALECAVDIQKELKKLNEPLPPDKKMAFRIGINLGDVIEDGDRIYGDGVNIAARIEGLAEPGGICISRTAFDAVGKKLPLGYAYLGEHEVKNIDKPVRVYRVLTEPEAAGKVIGEQKDEGRRPRRTLIAALSAVILIAAGLLGWTIYSYQSRKVEAASIDKMAYPLPEKPSIAVLAFDNLTGDPNLEYMCDGMSEEIINALSRNSQLFVIARNSSFYYKGKPVKIKQVSEELGVRYVLEGSIRKQGDRMRVTAQLIDAIKGYHMWSETFNRESNDLFALYDDITKIIFAQLQVHIIVGKQGVNWFKNIPPEKVNLRFWELNQKIFEYFRGDPNKIGYETAKGFANEMVDQWPALPSGYVYLGVFHLFDAQNPKNPRPAESVHLAEECAQKAIQTGAETGGIMILAAIHLYITKQHDLAIAEYEKWVAMEPNGSAAHTHLSRAFYLAGQFDKAIEYGEMGIRLDPFPPADWFSFLGAAYAGFIAYGPKHPEKAIELCTKAIATNQNDWLGHYILAQIYAYQNRIKEAQYHGSELRRILPRFSIKVQANDWRYSDKEALQPTLELLRKAGIPEG